MCHTRKNGSHHTVLRSVHASPWGWGEASMSYQDVSPGPPMDAASGCGMALSFGAGALALATHCSASFICGESPMLPLMRRALFFLVFSLLLSPTLTARPNFPSPDGYVTDTAHLLRDSDRQLLNAHLLAYEKQTSNE